MSAAGDAPRHDASTERRLAIVIALGVEKASLRAAIDGLRPDAPLDLIQCGPGPENATRGAREALARGASSLVSWGLAGGLEPGLAAGSVVVPTRIALVDGERHALDSGWTARIAGRLSAEFAVDRGDLLTTARVLGTPRAKARAAVETGCVAVDMESGAVAAVAAQAGVPAAVVRVVADDIGDTLPRNIADWVTRDGERCWPPVVNAIFSPSQWRDLVRLAHRHRIADRTLSRLAERLVPTVFERATTAAL